MLTKYTKMRNEKLTDKHMLYPANEIMNIRIAINIYLIIKCLPIVNSFYWIVILFIPGD